MMQKFLDKFAVGISSVCAVHCLLTPIAITVFPMFGLFLGGYFHLVMYVIIMPTSMFALLLGCRKHQDKIVGVLGITGLVLLSIALLVSTQYYSYLFVSNLHTATGTFMKYAAKSERVMTLLGGLCLIGAHVRNYSLCRHDHCEH